MQYICTMPDSLHLADFLEPVSLAEISNDAPYHDGQIGKDIIVYGGSSFVAALIKEGLIDEFHLFVNPIALGKGVPVFDQLQNLQQLKLKKSIEYPCGIVLLNYEFK